MKKGKLHLTFMICNLLLAACNPGSKYAAETDQLSNYLQQTFNIKIDDTKTVYVFIPGEQCAYCSRSLGANIDTIGSIPIKVISSLKFIAPQYQAYVDYNNNMARMRFLNYSNTLVLTSDRRIIAIEPFNDTTDLLRFYRLKE